MQTRQRGIAKAKLYRGFYRVIAVLLAFGVAFIYWAATRPIQPINISDNSSSSASENLGTPSDFTLPLLLDKNGHGSTIQLSALRGKPILLNFWASWCPPCVEELPSLLRFSHWAAEHLGVIVLGLSEDENPDAVRRFVKGPLFKDYGANLPMQIMVDPRGQVAGSYGTHQFPETFFIDKSYNIVKKFVGPQDWMSEEITKWISEHSK